MTEPSLVFEFQTKNGQLWQVSGWSNRRRCEECSTAMEVQAVAEQPASVTTPFGVPLPRFGDLFIDEAADPQVTVNGIIDWLEEIAA